MQHFSKNTVMASEWCKRCGKNTMHRVDGVKLGPCLDCIKNLGEEAAKAQPKAAVQEGLFK